MPETVAVLVDNELAKGGRTVIVVRRPIFLMMARAPRVS